VSVAASVSSSTVVVAVDVGKNCVALSVTDAGRHRLFGPVEVAMTRPALDRVVARIGAVLSADGVVKVGVEAARALPPADDHRVVVAGGLGGTGTQPRACRWAAAGRVLTVLFGC
jgi:hypothetical protein